MHRCMKCSHVVTVILLCVYLLLFSTCIHHYTSKIRFTFLSTVTVLWCCWYTMWLHVHVCILLELVCYLGYWYILYVTLLYCCYLIQNKQTPVWVAALYDNVGALNVLIRAKADVNAAEVVSLIYFYGSNNKFYWAASRLQASFYYLLHVHVSIPTIIKSEILYQHLTHASLICSSNELHPHLTIPGNNKQ